MTKSKLTNLVTNGHHATSTYYNFPTRYERAKKLKGAKIGPEKTSKLLSIDNEQGTCLQPL